MCVICAVQNKKSGGYGCADTTAVSEPAPGDTGGFGGFDSVGQTPGADTVAGSTATTRAMGIGGAGVRGYANFGGDQDWYRINLVAGHQYTFALSGFGFNALEDTFLRIFNSAGGVVNNGVAGDDAGPLLNSRVTFTAGYTGVYYISAGGFGTETGQYLLTGNTGSTPYEPPVSVTDVANYIQYSYWNVNNSGPREWAPGNQNVSYNVTGLSAARQTLAHLAFAMWGEISGLNFTSTTGVAEIRLDDTQSGAFANTSFTGGSDTTVGTITSATINVATNWFGGSSARDSYTFQTFIHEIGHTLGLGHSGPYNGSATYGVDNTYRNDSWQLSIMSYMDQFEAAQGTYRFTMTPMMADILAIHRMYGAQAVRTGNTTYGHGGNAPGATGWFYNFANFSTAPAFTIVDTGGIDTLNASGYANNQVIDLRGGFFSSIGGLSRNIGIYTTTVIERAVGGSGNDNIIGNSANNVIWGNNGNDILRGFGGIDSLNGGNGQDLLLGGLHRDVQVGGPGNDIFRFAAAADSVVGANADSILDFDDSGDDRIDLSFLSPGVMTYRHNLGFFAAGQVRIADIAGPDLLVQINLGGTLAADMEIRLVNTLLGSMTASDFIL